MTITTNDIKWGRYSNFEGPFFIGKQRYVLPDNPTENDKIMNVITSAEGGAYDAINMYDAGIVSVGLIQWINAGQHSVDAMLGRVITDCGEEKVFVPLSEALTQSNATFKKNEAGQWRFFNEKGEVSSNAQQRQLFMLGCGQLGTWHPKAIQHAKMWAAGLANVFADPAAQKAQVDYTVPRLKEFLFGNVRTSLYDGSPDEGWVACARAAVISFAVNVPGMTAPLYMSYATTTKAKKWSSDWVVGLLKHITFQGPKSNIWLARYNAIRPVLEKLYGVKLPKSTRELSVWSASGIHINAVTPPKPLVQIPPPPAIIEETVPAQPVSPVILPPEPINEVTPVPTPVPLPVTVPIWKSIINFIMMIINSILRKKN